MLDSACPRTGVKAPRSLPPRFPPVCSRPGNSMRSVVTAGSAEHFSKPSTSEQNEPAPGTSSRPHTTWPMRLLQTADATPTVSPSRAPSSSASAAVPLPRRHMRDLDAGIAIFLAPAAPSVRILNSCRHLGSDTITWITPAWVRWRPASRDRLLGHWTGARRGCAMTNRRRRPIRPPSSVGPDVRSTSSR